jgi:hypothetical protein
VDISYQARIDKLNREVGKYHSGLQKRNWTEEDPMLYEMSIKKIQDIENKVQSEYQFEAGKNSALKIVELDNQALLADTKSMQKEILKGNFKLSINT